MSLAKLGAGFDIVTGGELARVLKAGGDASKIVFSGLGKTEVDIQKSIRSGYCMLQCGVLCRAGSYSKSCGEARQKSAHFIACQSRCRCENPSLYFNRA